MDPALTASLHDRLKKELDRFREDYRTHHLPGETKGPEIGAPFFLHNPRSPKAVLLVHGFMAAPYEVRQWADDFFSHGYTVYAPRLAGHGTSAVDLAARNYTDWIDSVERGYDILSVCSHRIIVAGFSTGAGLALHQAIHHPHRYQAVISVSAPMKFKGLPSKATELIETWNKTASMCKMDSLQKTFATNHPDNPEINYHRCPIHGFNQVKSLMRNVYHGLPDLSVPTLVVQGNRDPKVSPRAGRLIFDRIGIAEKKYVEIDHPRHGIVRGDVGTSVFKVSHEFLSPFAAR